jgi:hypothetical protein
LRSGVLRDCDTTHTKTKHENGGTEFSHAQ